MILFFLSSLAYLLYYNTFQKRFSDYKKNIFKQVEN